MAPNTTGSGGNAKINNYLVEITIILDKNQRTPDSSRRQKRLFAILSDHTRQRAINWYLVFFVIKQNKK